MFFQLLCMLQVFHKNVGGVVRLVLGLPGSSSGKESTCNAGDPSSIPGLGRYPGESPGEFPLQYSWASRMAQTVKNLPAKWETWVWSLGWEVPPKEGMVTHWSILNWRIPWAEEPGGLQSMRSQRIGHDWVTQHSTAHRLILQYFIPNRKNHWNSQVGQVRITCEVLKYTDFWCLPQTIKSESLKWDLGISILSSTLSASICESRLVFCDSLRPHGLLQARILEWVDFPFSRESSQLRDWTQVSHMAGGFFTSWATRKPKSTGMGSLPLLQQIFPSQELEQGLQHCRWILYQLSY